MKESDITKKDSVFAKLKKLFSDEVIIRQVGGKKIKVADTESGQFATDRNSLRDRFNRLRSSAYGVHSRDMAMSYQSARLELFRDYDCIGESTIVPLPDGSFPTIKELADRYKDRPEERFYVFSYDHETRSVVFGQAYHPRKKGVRKVFKVTFQNGQHIIGSSGHPFLMSDGYYKKLEDVEVGESVMPFSKILDHRDPDMLRLDRKIVSIEAIGEADVYDVTVEKYQNFATDSCFVHNTMDMHSMISSALDIYADEIVTQNEFGKVLTITTEDDNLKEILENLFFDIMNVEFNLWSWTRNLCKYGDFYLLLDISPQYGVYNVHPLSAYEVTRVEGTDPENKSYVKFQHDGAYGGQEYENFEVAHFRLLSDSNFLPYGRSMLEGARRVWKQYNLMVDAMLIHRIMRAPEKRIFKIDIGNIEPDQVDGYMEKLISRMKKVPYIDERTGDYNLRFNLQNMVEDFFLPVRGSDSGTSIDSLGGMEYTGIDDIEFLKNELLAGLKIPKAFLTYDEAIGGKSVLNQEDIRFAKTIGRLQKMVISELNKIAVIHLYVQGYRDASLLNFKLELTNPSAVLEQEKISLWQDKLSLAKDMDDSKLFDSEYIYKEVFKLSKQQIDNIRTGIVSDQKNKYRISQIEETGNDPRTSGQSVDSEGGVKDLPEDPVDGLDGGGDAEEPTNPDLEDFPPLKEEAEYERPERDQSGIKDASNYPFGENPLGKHDDEESRTDPIRHTHRGGLLSIRESDLEKMLEKIEKKSSKKVILSESKKSSMLDESQISEEE